MEIDHQPSVEQPNLIAAFQGWNDAGQAATTAVRYLVDSWHATPFARLDPEEYYSFSDTRPNIRIVDGERRELSWPRNEFFWYAGKDGRPDCVLMIGTEPNLKWRSFCAEILQLAKMLRAQRIFTLGALVADAVHTRPVPLTGFSSDPQIRPKLVDRNITRSSYEGPTGIVGVLHDACLREGIMTASVWAATPYYLGATPNPRTALGLLETLDEVLELKLNLRELRVVADEFLRQVSMATQENTEIRGQIEALERRYDELGAQRRTEFPSTRALIADLEDFLREQRDEERGAG